MTSERRHLHPLAAVSHGAEALRGFALPLLVALVLGTRGDGAMAVAVGLVGVVVASVVGIARWQRTTYAFDDRALHLRSGLLSPDESLVRVERVQSIDVTQGPLQRLLGLAELQVRVAGGGDEPALALRGLGPDAIAELRVALGQPEPAGPDERRRLARGALLVAALTAPQFATVVPVASALGALGNELGLANVRDWFERVDRPSVAIPLILGLAAASWLLSFVGALVAFSGFELERNARRLHVRRGLLRRRAVTVPLARVDGITLVEGLLRRPFGLVSVRLETAGLRGAASAERTLFPLLPRAEVPALLAQFVPELAGSIGDLARPPARAARRYATPPALAALLAATMATSLRGELWPLLVVLPIAAGVWGASGRRSTGLRVDGDRLVMQARHGGARRTLVARRHRLQRATVSQSPLQRRGALRTLSARVGSGAHPRLRHLDDDVALRAFDRLAP